MDSISDGPIRVLHVDDEDGFLKASRQILETNTDFQVETVSSVEEALKKTIDWFVENREWWEKVYKKIARKNKS